MSLTPWSPFKDMERFSKDMQSFFDFSPFKMITGNTPSVDVFQTENEVIIHAEIPGISKEDLNIFVDENTLRLSGQTKRNDSLTHEHSYRSERYFGSFQRIIPLPAEVKSEQAKACYADGVLSIEIPKAAPSKLKSKRIEID